MSRLCICKEYEGMFTEGFRYVESLEKHDERVKKKMLDDIILFIEEWRDRQTCIGREVVSLITNELIDSIKSEHIKENSSE